METTNNHGLHRSISLFDTVMIAMGSSIGSGIFFVPAAMAAYLHASGLYLGVWVLGGIVSLLGALSLAELGAAMPHPGGQYVYLREAYGPVWGFLCGWTSFAVVMTASIAAVAEACADCVAVFIPLSPLQVRLLAILSIWLLTGINCLGVKSGTRVQNLMTVLKIGSLIALIVLGVSLAGGSLSHFAPVLPTQPWTELVSPLGLALVGVLWAYDGWIQVSYIAGEIKNPQKTIPQALLISILSVIGLYLVVNTLYVYLLSLPGMANTPMVAAKALQVVIGPVGITLVTAAIFISTLGANNGFILSGARIYYAMACDGAFFPQVARLNRAGVPVVSLVIQAVWASLLTLSGSYEQLFTYVVFAAWLFYALGCAAIFTLRQQRPGMHRPYKTWGYPVTPIVFILFAVGLVLNTLWSQPQNSVVGLGIMLLGLPAYFYCKKHASKAAISSADSAP